MKGINFNYYKSPVKGSVFARDRDYSVFVKRGVWFRVSSKRKMLAFLAESSRFYTIKLYSLISVFSDIQQIYWSNWGQLSAHNQEILKNIGVVSSHLERIPQESNNVSGFSYVNQRINMIYQNLTEINNFLLEELPKTNTPTIYQIKGKQLELDFIFNEIENF